MSMLLMFGDDGFNPRTLFAANEQGAWYDPSDFRTLYQDAAGTTPVTVVGQPVGRINDKSGRGNHATQATAGNRPVLRQDSSGRYYLEFDGATSNRWLQTSSINFTGTNKMTLWAGVRKLSDAASGVVAELSAGATANNGAFVVHAPRTASASYGIGVRGTSVNAGDYSTFTAPITNVISASLTTVGNNIAATIAARFNGASNAGVANSNSPSTGNFGNFPLYIGRRAGTSLPFNGRLYGLIIRGAASNADQIVTTESWMNSKTRAY